MALDLITCAKGLTNAMVPAGGGTVQREDIRDADGCDPRRRIAHDRAVPRIHILVPSGGDGRGFGHVGLLSGSPASAQPRGKDAALLCDGTTPSPSDAGCIYDEDRIDRKGSRNRSRSKYFAYLPLLRRDTRAHGSSPGRLRGLKWMMKVMENRVARCIKRKTTQSQSSADEDVKRQFRLCCVLFQLRPIDRSFAY